MKSRKRHYGFIVLFTLLLLLSAVTLLAAGKWPLASQDATHAIWHSYGQFLGPPLQSIHFHEGIDIPVDEGSQPDVLASENGAVVELYEGGSHNADFITTSSASAAGKGWFYCHIDVAQHPTAGRKWRVGDAVAQGNVLGNVHNQTTMMDHLHLQFVNNSNGGVWHPTGYPLADPDGDPIDFLSQNTDNVVPSLIVDNDGHFFYREGLGEGDPAARYFTTLLDGRIVISDNVDIVARAYDQFGTHAGIDYDVGVKKIEFKVTGWGDISTQVLEDFSGLFLIAEAPAGRNAFNEFRNEARTQTIYERDNTVESRDHTGGVVSGNQGKYYHILTNKDDDDNNEFADARRYWDTDGKEGEPWNDTLETADHEAANNADTEFPDGFYTVNVTAYSLGTPSPSTSGDDYVYVNNFSQRIIANRECYTPGEPVYICGVNFLADAIYTVYLIRKDVWPDHAAIPHGAIVEIAHVITDSQGNIPYCLLWDVYTPNGAPDAGYDIVVDYDRDGEYHLSREGHTIDALTHIVSCPAITIPTIPDAYQGTFKKIAITLDDGPVEMGGFDFLIAYDASALTFTEATKGQLLDDCGWEYFTYRHGVQGNCGDACPSGLLRIIAIAETNNGPYQPSCYGPLEAEVNELVTLGFLVTNDYNFNGQFVPIYFFWDDCGDNSISNVDGDTLYIDRAVFDFEETLIWDEEDDDQFPEDARIPFVGAPDYCFNPDPDKPSAIRLINFVNGGIGIISLEDYDDRGDINLNGVPNEIADATVFTNYFIYGLDAFTINVEGQTAATDLNADGTPLTVGDLVYLIRVIVGDALPIPKLTPNSQSASANMLVNHSALSISTNSPVDLGAGYFVFKYSGYTIGKPHLINGASDMTLKWNDENGILKILVYSMEEGRQIAAGMENLFLIPIEGDGMIELTEVQLSDYNGNMMVSKVEDKPILPKNFALHQNYPNPFNMTTQIIYELPGIAHVRIDVINMMGQKVTTLINSEQSAGVHRVEWKGTDQSGNEVASGIYFYRLDTEGYVETKKMTLLK